MVQWFKTSPLHGEDPEFEPRLDQTPIFSWLLGIFNSPSKCLQESLPIHFCNIGAGVIREGKGVSVGSFDITEKDKGSSNSYFSETKTNSFIQKRSQSFQFLNIFLCSTCDRVFLLWKVDFPTYSRNREINIKMYP
ncbi:hypothetical protein VIN7_5563 [Saccharomyces cerevisiae x Saccharomyces kudriavzevii VIN7]|uniref:Uncharacterized protein n=1 Tax=Saccharomyces cerevisiae x Saccharomyces kudriavzevii (strain VIN7) TaxID=1095631 RepID=H0GR71_SACCK|nr:hypothetical protein VIN7_5563 [Saccharomyces cerevisiae x Saccharomyces kudriavzevii VIN7]